VIATPVIATSATLDRDPRCHRIVGFI